mmetsp:Transcript_39817/g.94994  ORF Transcript_39817/g.94994 Transcript_39817/m.94994 type:complete len:298 (+) Transcript_39817:4869-5762(+)
MVTCFRSKNLNLEMAWRETCSVCSSFIKAAALLSSSCESSSVSRCSSSFTCSTASGSSGSSVASSTGSPSSFFSSSCGSSNFRRAGGRARSRTVYFLYSCCLVLRRSSNALQQRCFDRTEATLSIISGEPSPWVAAHRSRDSAKRGLSGSSRKDSTAASLAASVKFLLDNSFSRRTNSSLSGKSWRATSAFFSAKTHCAGPSSASSVAWSSSKRCTSSVPSARAWATYLSGRSKVNCFCRRFTCPSCTHITVTWWSKHITICRACECQGSCLSGQGKDSSTATHLAKADRSTAGLVR